MGLGVAGTAAAIGAAGSVASAGIGALSSHAQSGQAAAGAAQAQADLAPFRTAGTNALNVTGDLAGANGPAAQQTAYGNFTADPGYQFMYDQGLRAVDAGAASKGILHSGATIKGEENFATGLAQQDFGNYYNRLFNLAQLGETAGAGGAALAQSAGNTQANITGNLGGGLTNTVNSLFSNPSVQSGIKSLFGTPSTPSTQSTLDMTGLQGFVQQ